MRNQDWQVMFAEYYESRANMPFEWGQNDCCYFAADWVSKVYGVNIAVEHRGTYNSALGAARLIEQLGGLEAIVAEHLVEHPNPLFARIGDILLIENNGRDLLAICNGLVAFAPGESGIINLVTAEAKKAWIV